MGTYVCIVDEELVDLTFRKIYQALEDDFAHQVEMIRVIDDSGEDYLHSAHYFKKIKAPEGLFPTKPIRIEYR